MSNEQNITPMTPDELEANGLPRDFHTRPAEAQPETRTWDHTGPHTDAADRSAPDPYQRPTTGMPAVGDWINNQYAPQPAARRAGKTTRLAEFKAMHDRKKWVLPAALAAVVFLLGLGIGSSGEPETVEVIKEVEKPVDRIVEKRVEVPKTPTACLTALDLNEQAFSGLSESMGHIIDQNYTAATASTERVKGLTSRVNAAKAECRASK